MVKSELIKRSPLRIMEKSAHGGVGAGNIGVIASKKGIGKTACLVHIATDKLLQDNHVIHVSFSSKVDHIYSWYEDIFAEISKKRELEKAMDVHDEIVHNRVIMNFSQRAVKTGQVLSSLKAMIENGQINTEVVVIDGYAFQDAGLEDIKAFRAFAQEQSLELWFTASYPEDQDKILDGNGVPRILTPFLDELSLVITMENTDNQIVLKLVKDQDRIHKEDLHLKLNAKTLLIDEE